jgi:hypothetical protein
MPVSIRKRKYSEYLKEEITFSNYHVEIVSKEARHESISVQATHENPLPHSDTKFSEDDDLTTFEDYESTSSFSSLYEIDFASL